MWVYVKSEPACYTVGHYDPAGTWHADSDHAEQRHAADRVHYLNGGRELEPEAFTEGGTAGAVIAAISDVLNCAHMQGPANTTAYLISDGRMAALRAAFVRLCHELGPDEHAEGYDGDPADKQERRRGTNAACRSPRT